MHRTMLLSTRKITPFELIGWLLFFSFFLVAELLRFGAVETLLLIIGFCIGLFSIYKVAVLGREDYKKHRREITAWLIRFVVFKVAPLAIAVI